MNVRDAATLRWLSAALLLGIVVDIARCGGLTGVAAGPTNGPISTGGPMSSSQWLQTLYLPVDPQGVLAYNVDQNTGALTAVPNGTYQVPGCCATLGSLPQAVVQDDSHTLAAILTGPLQCFRDGCSDDGLIGIFRRDTTTGALMLLGPPTILPFSAERLVFDHSGLFLYVVPGPDSAANTGIGYAVDRQTGVLMQLSGVVLPSRRRMLLHPAKQLLYNFSSVQVNGHDTPDTELTISTIGPDGSLRPINGSPFLLTGLDLTAVQFDRGGQLLYLIGVPNLSSPTGSEIALFTVNPDGSPALPASATTSFPGFELSMILPPTVPETVFTTSQMVGAPNLFGFALNTTPFSLNRSFTASVPMNGFGWFVGASANGSFVYLRDTANRNVYIYSVSPAGTLTLTGQITLPPGP